MIFFCLRQWSDLVQNDVDCGDVVEIGTGCRIPTWWTFGWIQWHVSPEPPATLQGAATWRIQCHDFRATCHIAGCCHWANLNGVSSQSDVSHCRVLPLGEFTVTIPEPHATLQGAVTWQNQCHDHATLQGIRIPSAILKIVFHHIFLFLMQFRLWRAAASYRLRYTCLRLFLLWEWTRPMVSACAAWHQMLPICTEWWCTEANKATQTQCYNPIAPAYPIWAYYAHGW